MSDTGGLIPYCIYHYIDPSTETYLGYIGTGRKVLLEDGSYTYDCQSEPVTLKQWFRAEVFYALRPSYRPIPSNMKLFCIEVVNGFPYDSKNLKTIYDPFHNEKICEDFITYNQPVPNTERLYIHKIANHIFPSFNKDPPTKNSNWTQTDISPIFVMTERTVGNIFEKGKSIKFKCNNGRCLPWVNNIPDMYGSYDDNLLPLDECVLYCNELRIVDGSEVEPTSLIDSINNNKVSKLSIKDVFKNVPGPVVGLLIFLFIILLFYIIYMFLNVRSR